MNRGAVEAGEVVNEGFRPATAACWGVGTP